MRREERKLNAGKFVTPCCRGKSHKVVGGLAHTSGVCHMRQRDSSPDSVQCARMSMAVLGKGRYHGCTQNQVNFHQ